MWPRWAKNLDYELIRRVAVSHAMEPALVAAVVQVESMGNTYACAYEPDFTYTYQIPRLAKVCHATIETMLMMQKTSWGLMQVMGAVAYEHKLEDEFTWHRRWPTALTNPAIGLKYGCLHLKLKYEKYGPDPKMTYAAYNAGSPRYDQKGNLINLISVNRFLKAYQELK